MIIEAISTFAGGMASGIVVSHFMWPRKCSQEELSQFLNKQLNRVVNIESIEEHERLLKVRMARQGLKTIRIDGGPNAKITKMRIGPRPKTRG